MQSLIQFSDCQSANLQTGWSAWFAPLVTHLQWLSSAGLCLTVARISPLLACAFPAALAVSVAFDDKDSLAGQIQTERDYQRLLANGARD